MPDNILVLAEQREGKLNRVSWETLTAGQSLAAEAGWMLEAAVVGSGVTNLASEIAGKKVAKVFAIESPKLEPYTPDAFVTALKQFLSSHPAKLVLMPHTYQVRDFVPKLATTMGRTAITDCVGYSKNGDKLLFTRQMFQGKLAADVSFACDAPWFVTFQNGAFRGDKVEAGSSTAPVETVTVDIPDSVIRTKPQAVFKEAKQAVDLTQAEIIVAIGRGIKEREATCRSFGGRDCRFASDLRLGMASHGSADRIVGADSRSETVSRTGDQRRYPAHCRNERCASHCRDQQRFGSAHFRNR